VTRAHPGPLLVPAPSRPGPSGSGKVSLSAPLTDGAIIGLLAVIVWVLWAQLMVCILVEAIAGLTDDRIQLNVPFTLGVQQHLARRLITAVVVATVATPVAAAAMAAPSALAVPRAPAATSAGRRFRGPEADRSAGPSDDQPPGDVWPNDRGDGDGDVSPYEPRNTARLGTRPSNRVG